MIGLLLIAAAQGWTVYASGELPKPKDHVEFYDRCVGERIVKLAWDTNLPSVEILADAQHVCRPKAKAFKPRLKRLAAENQLTDIDTKYAKTSETFICSIRAAVSKSALECENSNAQD